MMDKRKYARRKARSEAVNRAVEGLSPNVTTPKPAATKRLFQPNQRGASDAPVEPDQPDALRDDAQRLAAEAKARREAKLSRTDAAATSDGTAQDRRDDRRAARKEAQSAAASQAEAARQAAEQTRRRAEETARKRAEAAKRRKAEEEARHAAEAAERVRVEEDHRAEEEAARQAAAAAARRKAEAALQRHADMKARERQAEEDMRRAEEDARKRAEDKARREAEEAERKRAEDEAQRKAEEALRKHAEDEARREAEEALRKHAEDEAQRKAEEAQRKRTEEEAKRKAEEAQRKRTEEEARRKAEETQRKRAEDEARREAERQSGEIAALREIQATARRKAEERLRQRARDAARQETVEDEPARQADTAGQGPVIAAQPGPTELWHRMDSFQVDERHLDRNRIVTASRYDPAHTAFDILRTRLLQALSDKGWKRVAITSPTKGCGKSFMAANLAISLSRQENCRSILLDLDLRQPSQAGIFGVSNPKPIGDFLRGQVEAEDFLLRLGRNSFHAGHNIAFGFNDQTETYASELLQDPRAIEALDRMEDRLQPDVILFDLPPALYHDDVMALRPQFDGVLLVVGGGLTTSAEIKEVERRLGEDTPLLGSVLNKAEGENIRQYSY